MRKLWPVSGALLAGFGIVSTNLWLELRAERRTNSELLTQLEEARAVPHAPAAPMQPAAAAAAAVAPTAGAAAVKPVPPPPDSEVAMKARDAAISAGAIAAATGSGEQDLMKDPEYRKAQLTLTRLRLAQSNPGFADALGLSDKEASHVFEIMAEQQLQLTAEFSSATAGGVNAKAMDEVMQRTRAAGDPMRAVLGEAKYAQYQDYQQNVRPALTQVAGIGSTLSAAGQPLNESQSRGLTSAMLAEQQRQKQEAQARGNANRGTPRSMADTLEESARRQDESNRRILEASAAYFNAAQQQVLREKYEQQAAQRRRTIETARDLDARRGLLPPPPTPPVTAP